MLIPSHILDAIKRATNLPTLVQESRPLRKQGFRHVGWCPFCPKPRTPAFYVYQDHAWCFRCQRHLTCFDWLKEMAGMTFQEAASELADRAGISLTGTVTVSVQRAADVEDARLFPLWVEEQQALVRRTLDAALADGPPEKREDYEFCRSLGRLLRHQWTVQEFRCLSDMAVRKRLRAAIAWDKDFTEAWMGLAVMGLERAA